MATKQDRPWARDSVGVQACQVPHFLLCPQTHHLSWVVAGVTMTETKLSSNVLVTVFEDQNGCLIDLDSTVTLLAGGEVDIGLLSCADAAIDL